MASLSSFRSWSLLVLLVAASATLSTARAQLQYGYYNTTCPGVEDLVRAEVLALFAADMTLPAGLLRLHFHDCFGAGCDATIMLKSHNGTAQRDADPNSTVRGYEAIEAIKAKVEAACPLVVSCADIMAMAACDAPGRKKRTRRGTLCKQWQVDNFVPMAHRVISYRWHSA
jgi:peroxidase